MQLLMDLLIAQLITCDNKQNVQDNILSAENMLSAQDDMSSV